MYGLRYLPTSLKIILKVSAEELAVIRSTESVLADESTLTESEQKRIRWYHFFKNPTLVCNAIGYFAFQYVNFLILTWTPKYLQDNFHYSLSNLWYMGMIPWIGACITVVLGGTISDALRKKTGSLRIARSGLAVVSLIFTAACFLLIPTVHSVGAVLLLMAVGNAFNFLPNSVYWTVVIDTEPSKAGSFGGVTHFITNIATGGSSDIDGIPGFFSRIYSDVRRLGCGLHHRHVGHVVCEAWQTNGCISYSLRQGVPTLTYHPPFCACTE